jgi:hypothetical protein
MELEFNPKFDFFGDIPKFMPDARTEDGGRKRELGLYFILHPALS